MKKQDMEKQPLISVIIPVYNAEDTLDVCIQSVEMQEFDQYEIILVDDGSTDQSGIICDTRAEENKNIRVFHTENRGAAAARNYGIRQAKGEAVALIDSDDTVSEKYLAYLWELMQEYESEIAVCSYDKVYEGNKVIEVDVGEDEVRFCISGEDAVECLLYQKYFLSVPWGMISKRELWDKVQFPEDTKAEDMGTIYKLFAAADKVAYGSESEYQYFQRKSNTMFSTCDERNRDYYQHCREMITYVKKYLPSCRKAAVSRFFSACFQILSETPMDAEHEETVRRIYRDIRKMQNTVLLDSGAKLRNRMAAALSLVSIRMMHMALRAYYIVNRRIKL